MSGCGMSERPETIADIIAEMNRVEVCADGEPCLRDYARRFDAAMKREVDALNEQITDLRQQRDLWSKRSAELVEKCNEQHAKLKQVGNAAHLHAACVVALAELKRCHKCHDARLHFADIVHVGNAKKELETAIALPERNCDLFNFDDAEENARAAWDAFDGTLELNMAELSPREYAIVKECMAAFRWLFSHYKRQSEAAK